MLSTGKSNVSTLISFDILLLIGSEIVQTLTVKVKRVQVRIRTITRTTGEKEIMGVF